MLESSETGEQGQLGTVCVPVSESLHQRHTLVFTISTSIFSITVTPEQGQPMRLLGRDSTKKALGRTLHPGKWLRSLTQKGHLEVRRDRVLSMAHCIESLTLWYSPKGPRACERLLEQVRGPIKRRARWPEESLAVEGWR